MEVRLAKPDKTQSNSGISWNSSRRWGTRALLAALIGGVIAGLHDGATVKHVLAISAGLAAMVLTAGCLDRLLRPGIARAMRAMAATMLADRRVSPTTTAIVIAIYVLAMTVAVMMAPEAWRIVTMAIAMIPGWILAATLGQSLRVEDNHE